MSDPNALLVGGQADEGKTEEELEHAREEEERERQEFLDAWKAMYRREGIDSNTYRIDWDAVFEGERGE